MKIPFISTSSTEDEDSTEETQESDRGRFDHLSYEDKLETGVDIASKVSKAVTKRTIQSDIDIDDDSFFSEDYIDTSSFFRRERNGEPTITTMYDMEKQIPGRKKDHLREIDRYWVNKPFSFISIFHSKKENEVKYYVIEPYLDPIEEEILDFLESKVRDNIKYTDSGNIAVDGDREDKEVVIERVTNETMEKYFTGLTGLLGRISSKLYNDSNDSIDLGSSEINRLTERQIKKFLYYIKRDFIGYGRIDAIKNDISVEDISCNGYNAPVFVYHTEHEQIITNIEHGKDELDKFVINLAKRGGKSISKRTPQVDITLEDGSRGQLTYGREVSSHGTNYTIRQFKDVPFTPIDLISWNTFSLDQIAFLWLAIQNNKSMIIAGGTASGKTTTLNALSLFIPSSQKIVSIEDTREVELPQRNWVASITRPSFKQDGSGSVDEFDLLESSLRQRPDYLIMGEVRGEEGRTLFQVMSTGHTTYSTFHADSVGEVLRRFTTEPINVSKSIFTSVDLVSIQTSTRVNGNKVRRNKTISEVVQYNSDDDNIVVQDIYKWQAETDSFLQTSASNLIEEIKFDRGWDDSELTKEIAERKVVLAYLIKNGFKTYREVASTLQAYMTDPTTVITLIAEDRLESSLDNLEEIESIDIEIDEEINDLEVRPDPGEKLLEKCDEILEENKEWMSKYEGQDVSIEDAMPEVDEIFQEDKIQDDLVTNKTDEEDSDIIDEWAELEETLDDLDIETDQR